MGKYVALTGRVLLASLFFFAALNKYHALVHASSYKDFVLLENAIAPRFAETKAALQRKYSEIYPRTNEREESVFVGFLEEVDDAKVLMIATLCELFGSVLLMFNFTLGSKLLMVFVVCVTPVMHPFWRREELSAAREIEAIMFFKNVAIFGALLMHVGLEKEKKIKEKDE